MESLSLNNKNSSITIFIIALFFITFMYYLFFTSRKEKFFFWHDTPLYVDKEFNMKSALFMAEFSNLKTFKDTLHFLEKYQFPIEEKYFSPEKNVVSHPSDSVDYIWIVSTQNKSIYINFIDLENTAEQNEFVKIPYIPESYEGIFILKSFLSKWNKIREEIFNIVSFYQPDNLFLTGINGGGSIAQFCAYDLKMHVNHMLSQEFNPIVYTFDSYAFGNIGFAMDYNKKVPSSYRIINKLDKVDKYMMKKENERTFEIDNEKLFHVNIKKQLFDTLNSNNFAFIIKNMIDNNIECDTVPFEDKSNYYMGYRNLSKNFPPRKTPSRQIWI